MSFFRRLFGLRDATDELIAKGLLTDINRTITVFGAPEDHKLRKLAEERKGHISLKAVDDEYERLILEKHRR